MLDNKNLFRDLLFFVALVGLLRNLAKPEIVAQSSNTTFKPRRLSKRPAPKKALSTSTNKLNPDHKNKLSNKNLNNNLSPKNNNPNSLELENSDKSYLLTQTNLTFEQISSLRKLSYINSNQEILNKLQKINNDLKNLKNKITGKKSPVNFLLGPLGALYPTVKNHNLEKKLIEILEDLNKLILDSAKSKNININITIDKKELKANLNHHQIDNYLEYNKNLLNLF